MQSGPGNNSNNTTQNLGRVAQTLLNSLNDVGRNIPQLLSCKIQKIGYERLVFEYQFKRARKTVQFDFYPISTVEDLGIRPVSAFSFLSNKEGLHKNTFLFYSTLRFPVASSLIGLWIGGKVGYQYWSAVLFHYWENKRLAYNVPTPVIPDLTKLMHEVMVKNTEACVKEFVFQELSKNATEKFGSISAMDFFLKKDLSPQYWFNHWVNGYPDHCMSKLQILVTEAATKNHEAYIKAIKSFLEKVPPIVVSNSVFRTDLCEKKAILDNTNYAMLFFYTCFGSCAAVLGYLYCSKLLNAKLHSIVNELKQAMDAREWSKVNEHLQSKIVQFSLHYADYILIRLDHEIKSFLWYCFGQMNEERGYPQKAIENYRMAYQLAETSHNQFMIGRQLYKLLHDNTKNDNTFYLEMESILTRFSKKTGYFYDEWALLFQKLEKAEKLFLNQKIMDAYDEFNRISSIDIFTQKLYPRLSVRYYQLQAALILSGQLEEVDRLENSSRIPLAIAALENILSLCQNFCVDEKAVRTEKTIATLSQLRDLLPEQSIAKPSVAGMYSGVASGLISRSVELSQSGSTENQSFDM